MNFQTACRWALLALLLSLLRTCSGRVLARGKAPPPNPWTLLWSDEFNGPTLNASIWEVQTGSGCEYGICGWGNNEQVSHGSHCMPGSHAGMRCDPRTDLQICHLQRRALGRQCAHTGFWGQLAIDTG